MYRYWIVIGFILTVAVLFHFLARPRHLFVILIRDGRVASQTGLVPPRFVDDVEHVCGFWSIREGKLIGIRRGRRVRISVGGGIDPKHAQVFQNAWEHPIK